MCGIYGYVNWAADLNEQLLAPVLAGMGTTLRHRGPDSTGEYREFDVGLGVCRLAIVDLPGGEQPFFNETRSVVLVCNGEIFNYPELRAQLEGRGHHFRSRCDVEVIVHLYEEYGVDLLHRLNGQFAFALFDRRERTLILARDPFGICPMFFTATARTFIFGSEIRAILAHPAIDKSVDLIGLDQVLSLPGLVSPRTMFEGIESLRPGHYLKVANDDVSTHEYWDLIYPTVENGASDQSNTAAGAHVKDLVERAVTTRLQSDVPMGVYVSGGLDSGIIACSLTQRSSDDVTHSFSIRFDDRYFDESVFQDSLTMQLPYRHRSELVTSVDIANELPRAISHSECPLRESYNVASLRLSRMAHEAGIRVVFSGDGSDELFGGYQSYRFDQLRSDRKIGVGANEAVEAESRERLWGDASFAYEHNFAELLQVKKRLYSRALSENLGQLDFRNYPLVDANRLRGRHAFHKRSYLDFKLRLADHLLGDHGDRMSMANSVEARYPFLDLGLIEYVSTLPPDVKLRGFDEKYVLKQAFRGIVPDTIVDREKFPFAAPGGKSLLESNSGYVNELLSKSRIRSDGYFNPEHVRELVARYSQPGFQLAVPIETDWLMIVITFGMFLDLFELPRLG
jgi:asparagine synthase (glutamine-hydrolysing)